MAYSILEQLDAATGLLDVKEVARIFDCAEKKIRKEAARPAPVGLPCIRMGASTKFDPSALAYYVRRQSPTFALAHKAAQKGTT